MPRVWAVVAGGLALGLLVADVGEVRCRANHLHPSRRRDVPAVLVSRAPGHVVQGSPSELRVVRRAIHEWAQTPYVLRLATLARPPDASATRPVHTPSPWSSTAARSGAGALVVGRTGLLTARRAGDAP